MTSSATQTDADADEKSPLTKHLGSGVVLALIVVGEIAIFHANRWHVTPPTVFLSFGWLGVVLTARYLWQAGWSAADVELDDEDYWLPVGKKDELLAEKRSLLKAIKELEFDREMGKLSESDADDLTKHYRRKAIEVIKAIEALDDGAGGAGDDGEVDIATQIEREVNARLKVSAVADKAKKKKKTKSKKKPKQGKGAGKKKPANKKAEAETEGETEAESESESETVAETETESGAESESESESESEGETEAETESESEAESETVAESESEAEAGDEDDEQASDESDDEAALAGKSAKSGAEARNA